MTALQRPQPPSDLIGVEGVRAGSLFRPAPEMEAWLRFTFIDEESSLQNEEYEHLRGARIGVLWAGIENRVKGARVVGQAEIPGPSGTPWSKGRRDQQLEEWFGLVPDFVLIFDAAHWSGADDATACALAEHELLHCAQAVDAYGAPRFNPVTGEPVYAIRPHDVEEFVTVVARYGAGAAAGKTSALVEAANRGPTIAAADIAGACGTCGRAL